MTISWRHMSIEMKIKTRKHNVKIYRLINKRVDSEGVRGGGVWELRGVLQFFKGPLLQNINKFLNSSAQAQSIGTLIE
jgi:hypothetical protein